MTDPRDTVCRHGTLAKMWVFLVGSCTIVSCVSGQSTSPCNAIPNVDYSGNDLLGVGNPRQVWTTDACCAACMSVPACSHWTLGGLGCWLKNSSAGLIPYTGPDQHVASGSRPNGTFTPTPSTVPSPPAGPTVPTHSPTALSPGGGAQQGRRHTPLIVVVAAVWVAVAGTGALLVWVHRRRLYPRWTTRVLARYPSDVDVYRLDSAHDGSASDNSDGSDNDVPLLDMAADVG
eukprot:m.43005 g.43005  ORF g.43005 m.43005 type:complete len:232 (-) comp6349_c0_seq1:970-1665(-)